MANKYWLGGAAKIKQTQTYTFGGTIEVDDIVRVTIGTRIYNFVPGSAVLDTAVAALVTAWSALSRTLFPEFYEVIPTYDAATNILTLTARTEGVTFVVTMQPFEANGTTPATDVTIEGSNTATTGTAGTANSSPNDGSVAANWSAGTAPADGDTLIFTDNAIDLLDGLDLSAINVNVIQYMSYSGKIGRPATNPSGYPEYRRTYLRIGTDDSPAQTVTLGVGAGIGSGRIKIDAGGSATTFIVQNAGTASDAGFPAVMLKGTDAANTLAVNKGVVGFAVGGYDVAAAAEETGTLATLSVGYVTNQNGDATVRCGSGVTLTTIDQSGGKLEIASAATTITKTGGELTLAGTGVTVVTLNERGGSTFLVSTTTITTLNISNAGIVDYSRDMRAKVVTNAVNIYGNLALFRDPFKVTGAIAIDMEQGGALANLDLGEHFRITRGAAA